MFEPCCTFQQAFIEYYCVLTIHSNKYTVGSRYVADCDFYDDILLPR